MYNIVYCLKIFEWPKFQKQQYLKTQINFILRNIFSYDKNIIFTFKSYKLFYLNYTYNVLNFKITFIIVLTIINNTSTAKII